MTDWLPRLVARIPVPVHAKLLAAFLAIAGLLVTVGAVGLQVLSEANRRGEELVKLLEFPHQMVRQEAQFELAARNPANDTVTALTSVLKDSKSQLARLHARARGPSFVWGHANKVSDSERGHVLSRTVRNRSCAQ